MSDISNFLRAARAIDAAPKVTQTKAENQRAINALFNYWDFIDHVQFKGGRSNFAKVHREMVEFVQQPQVACNGSYAKGELYTNEGRRRLMLVARGHLKSTICSVGYALWRTYRNPNIRILVGTATKDLSTQFIKEIKQYLENEELQERVWNCRPHINGRLVPLLDKAGARRRDQLRLEDTEAEDKKIVWRSDAIQVIRDTILREPTILATSPGSNTTGMHFDLLIKDDIINDDTVATVKKMEDTLDWAQDLESVLDPQRKVLLMPAKSKGTRELWEIIGDEDLTLGTRYARGDYYEYILDNQESLGYNTFVRNVYKNGENSQDGYTWGERFNDYTVNNIRKRISAKRFASQYLNRIIAEEDQILSLSAITSIDPFWCEAQENGKVRINFPSKGAVELIAHIVVDPAISQKKTADNTVIMVGGFDSDRNLYILDCAWGKLLPHELVNRIFTLSGKWKIPRVTIEVVAFQQVLVHLVKSSFSQYRPITVMEYRPKGEKKARIASMLQPYFSNHKVYVSKGIMGIPQFRDEVEYFANDPNSSMHDDFVDAMAILAEIAMPSSAAPRKPRGRLNNLAINSKYGGVY